MEEQRGLQNRGGRVSSFRIAGVGERRSSDRYRPQHLEDSRGEGRLFVRSGSRSLGKRTLAGGRVNDGDSPQVAFTVDARKLTLVEDNKLSEGQQAEVQHTMHAKVLQSQSYPLISFHSTKIEKTGVNQWLVSGELTLHGQSRLIRAEVDYEEGAYTGRSTIKQADFGINPVSVAGGVVKVKNELEIQFVVVPVR
jgi:hypothetical protein